MSLPPPPPSQCIIVPSPSSIGTSFEKKKWMALDPCGLACVSLSYSSHIYALFTLYQYLIAPTNIADSPTAIYIFYVIYVPCSIMALVNLFTVQHTDPGAVPLGARPLPIEPEELDKDGDQSSLLEGQVNNVRTRRRGIRRCRKCNNNYKPPRSHHDSVTGRCIVKFDHFCPWAGNAIGALNHKFFFLFILYTFFTSITSLFILMLRFVSCGYKIKYDHLPDENDVSASSTTMHENTYMGSDSNETYTDTITGTANNETHHFRFLEDNDDDGAFDYVYEGCHEVYHPRVMLLVVMSIAFMIFTCCMLMEQADAIDSNTSKIARMKIAMGQNEDGEFDRKTEQCNEMFGIGPLKYNYMSVGKKFRWCDRGGSHVALHWFLPTPVRFPEGKLDSVLGFEFKEQWFGKIYQESMDEEEEQQEEGYHSGISVGSMSTGTKHSLELERAELGANTNNATTDLDGAEHGRIRGRSLLPSLSPSSSVIGSTTRTSTNTSTGRRMHQRQPKELSLEMNKVVEMKRVSSTRSSSASTVSKRSGGSGGNGGKMNDEKEDTSPSDTKVV